MCSDLAESEREAGVLRDALAESERLRVEAEAKVAAYVKLLAQSSTQYREMVEVLEIVRDYLLDIPGGPDRYANPLDTSPDDMTAHLAGLSVNIIDAVLNERSTP